MSFIDYGFDIFPFGSRKHREDVDKSGGDCLASRPFKDSAPEEQHSCYHLIIDHLIDLGTYTENELSQVRAELDRYRSLELTYEQIQQLQSLGGSTEFKNENSEGLIRTSKREHYRSFITGHSNESCTSSLLNLNESENAWNAQNPNFSFEEETSGGCCCSKNVQTPKQDGCGCGCSSRRSSSPAQQRASEEAPISDKIFRQTIIQKDSEIISLKTENAAKEAELRELEEQNKKLEMMIDKMKDDIEVLESSTKISQTQIVDVIQQKNDELEALKEHIERIKDELRDENHARLMAEDEVMRINTFLQEAQVLRKNLSDELKTTKRRLESFECSNASQAALVKQLQQERANLDKQNCEQENEIEKLLCIVKRLNEKYDKSKSELNHAKDEIEIREKKLAQCREQLETTEREVNRLIGELADCLGSCSLSDATSPRSRSSVDMYSQARELTRGLNKIVREHEQCQAHRMDLMREINRLGAINRSRGLEAIEEIKNDASREIARLKRVVTGADNYHAVKMDLKRIVDDLLKRMDARRAEKAERVYLEVASEASLALERLDKKMNEHDVYRRCESFLLLELENLQDALDGAEKAINDLDLKSIDESGMSKQYEEKRQLMAANTNYSVIESVLSKKILQRVQNSTQIVIRITTALRDDSNLKVTYNKKLESQLQQTLSALNEIGVEKCQLQSEVESLKAELNSKSNELRLINEKVQSRFEAIREENENLRKHAQAFEKKYLDSRADNSALIKKSDEMIESLQRDLENKDSRLQEYRKFNDYLNNKILQSSQTIDQLQNKVVELNEHRVNLDSFTALHDRIHELVKEKEELTEKYSILESQLLSYERNNNKLQNNIAKVLEDNENLKKGIKDFKSENDRMAASLARIESEQTNQLCLRCDQMIEKIGSMRKNSDKLAKCVFTNTYDSVFKNMEKELKTQRDKLNFQQKELLMQEKEIADKTKTIELLSKEISKMKKDRSEESLEILKKRIETLTRETTELRSELKQTLMKYEDKLAEMHKQYKHNEIELHKNHNDSIRRLEAKYNEMMKEEGKIFNTQSWLKFLNATELQELHDKICKTSYCSNNDKDVYENQPKKVSNKTVKKPIQAKKDTPRSIKTSASAVKPSSRQRISSRETASTHSIIIPEKDYTHAKSRPSDSTTRLRDCFVYQCGMRTSRYESRDFG